MTASLFCMTCLKRFEPFQPVLTGFCELLKGFDRFQLTMNMQYMCNLNLEGLSSLRVPPTLPVQEDRLEGPHV